MTTGQPEILSWDWREQPNLDQLAAALGRVSGGTVHLAQVDTGSDEYAIVLSPMPLSDAEVRAAWEAL
jgi:hypothetical protein